MPDRYEDSKPDARADFGMRSIANGDIRATGVVVLASRRRCRRPKRRSGECLLRRSVLKRKPEKPGDAQAKQ